jgi:large subunit ribosomal protein L9
MKIILTNEVSGLGTAGDIVEVKDGYARNYLVPRGFAIRWTKGGQKDVDAIRRARKIHEIQTIEQANEVKSRFGSVTPSDVVAAIKAVDGPLVDKRRVEIGSPIKTTGAHTVSVKLLTDVVAKINVDVVAA